MTAVGTQIFRMNKRWLGPLWWCYKYLYAKDIRVWLYRHSCRTCPLSLARLTVKRPSHGSRFLHPPIELHACNQFPRSIVLSSSILRASVVATWSILHRIQKGHTRAPAFVYHNIGAVDIDCNLEIQAGDKFVVAIVHVAWHMETGNKIASKSPTKFYNWFIFLRRCKTQSYHALHFLLSGSHLTNVANTSSDNGVEVEARATLRVEGGLYDSPP
jgi:hypothetical protein